MELVMDSELPKKCQTLFIHLNREGLVYKSQEELLQNCDSLRNGCLEIASFADDYNFGDVRANGFWTFVKIVNSFDELLRRKLSKKHPKYKELVLVSRALVLLLEIYQKLRREMLVFEINNNNHTNEDDGDNVGRNNQGDLSPNLHAPSHEYASDGFTSMLQRRKELAAVICTVGPFWLLPSVRRLFKMFAFGVAFMNTTFPKSVLVMSHKKSRGMRYAKALTTGRVIDMLDHTSNPFYTKMYVNFYHRNAVVKSKTRHLIVETLYEISLSGQLQEAVDNQARSVRVRILKDSGCDPNKDLIFHVHGGCFMKTTPEAHEIYLKDWISQMRGTTVFAVDYAKDKFPRGLQDVLDVYLWLTNSEEGARKVLGFVPHRVLFTGDSAGANLSLALTLLLNDLRGMETSLKIQMPVGLLGIYGVYNLLPVMSPARIISAIDPILQQAVTLSVLAFYCGDNEPLNGERHESQSRLGSTKNSPWFYGSRHYVHSNFERMTKLVRNPYVSPVFYEKFDELSEIPLCLASTHFCPLLDDSVSLAKIWKGPVLLDVMDGLSHAFMNYIDLSKDAKRANDKCVQRMKEMLTDKHSEANGFHEIRL